MADLEPVGVIGAGWVGLVTAARQSHEIFHAGDEARLAIVAGSAEELATRLGQAGELAVGACRGDAGTGHDQRLLGLAQQARRRGDIRRGRSRRCDSCRRQKLDLGLVKATDGQ